MFVQDTVTIVPQVKAVIGGRFDKIRRQSHNNPVANGVETEGPITYGKSDKFTYRAGLSISPPTGLTSTCRTPPRSGRTSRFSPTAACWSRKKESNSRSGQRFRFMQERLQLSAAFFHIEKRNVARSLPGGFFEPIGKLRSRGFETEVAGTVTPGLSVSAGYGYTDATFVDYYSGTINLTGNTPRRVPNHTVNFVTSYHQPYRQ